LIEGANQFRKAIAIEWMPHLPSPAPQQQVILRWLVCNSNQPAIAQHAKCISREASPGHIDGNDVFYHRTTDADVFKDNCASDVRPAKS
jgi:hypothetical protein